MDMDIALFDDTAGPQTRHQVVFAHHLALCRGQGTQDIQRPAVQLYRLAVAPQFAQAGIEPETSEADWSGIHRIRQKSRGIAQFFRSLNKDLKTAMALPSSIAIVAWTAFCKARQRLGKRFREPALRIAGGNDERSRNHASGRSANDAATDRTCSRQMGEATLRVRPGTRIVVSGGLGACRDHLHRSVRNRAVGVFLSRRRSVLSPLSDRR